jgi:hypothetical protein
MEKHVKITLQDWDYTCSDGCCHEIGTTITVNGEPLITDGDSVYSALLAVLEHLGYSVEIEQISEFKMP